MLGKTEKQTYELKREIELLASQVKAFLLQNSNQKIVMGNSTEQ